MVMLAPSNAAPQAERPNAGPSWSRLPLDRSARYTPAEDATSSFSGGAGVYGTYLDEVLMMRNAAGTKYYYHTNHLYSVHAVTNQSGAIVEAVQSYDAYGKPTILTGAGTDTTWFTGDDLTASTSALGNPWFYTGQRLDVETGLMYYKNRYYSAELGRFVSRDPIGYADGMGLYGAYFVPYNLDPLGNRNVKSVQKIVGTKPDGKMGPKTEQAIKNFQDYLRSKGFDPGPTDGIWGPKTEDAYKKWEKARAEDPEGPTYKNGLKSLDKGLDMLKKACKNCCIKGPPPACCTEDECKEEAEDIIRALKTAWSMNYGWGPHNAHAHPVGGYYCWDWTDIFNRAVSGLNLKCWENEKGYALEAAGGGCHWFVKLYACKKKEVGCTVNIDDGFYFKDKLVHEGQFPPAGGAYAEQPVPNPEALGRNRPLAPSSPNP